MSDYEISVKTNVDQFKKEMDYIAYKQIPFATSLALNSMAAKIIEVEKKNFQSTFDRPTPFTMNAMGMIPATKNNPQVTIFVKDIQATYLDPYEFGGKSIPAKPGNVAMLVPKAVGTNAYGNIPYGKMQQLLAMTMPRTFSATKVNSYGARAALPERKMYFIGSVTRGGKTASGLWMRTPGNKGLKLMIRFSDPATVTAHLYYMKRAGDLIDKSFDTVMALSVQHALDTAKT